MRKSTVGGERVDVLIVTAVKEEYDAVLGVHTGALARSAWEERPGPTGLAVAFRTFLTEEGGELRIAATRALDMGGVAAANAAVPLVAEYRPRCIAMCGVCAGRKGEVQLGDVIIADRLWAYDTGANSVDKDDQGREVQRFKADPLTYNLDPIWKQRAESFQPGGAEGWLASRPRSYDDQSDWLLERVLLGEDPGSHADQEARCANFDKVLDLLWEKRWLDDGTLTLTDVGRKHIEKKLLKHRRRLPAPKNFVVRVGPIGTGTAVVKDEHIFDKLSERMRKVLGLEMEAAAIGAIAHLHKVEHTLVMKGVMDFADPAKNDNFKEFAATASAECMIAFLRANLTAKYDPLDDLLDPGTAPLPATAGPAALLNARHAVVDFFGRGDVLADLRAFCETDKPVSARLLYGTGGMGKTRLLMELCKRLNEEKVWRAGFVPKDLAPDKFAELASGGKPTLAIIDYAESRSGLKELLEATQSGKASRTGRLRVVLLARNAGDWLTALCACSPQVKDLLSGYAAIELHPLAQVGSDREKSFCHAVERFAEKLGKATPAVAIPDLEDSRYDRVLYVHMAALATVESRPTTPATLLDDTLQHEQRFWLTQFPHIDSIDRQSLTDDICRSVSALTLTGGARDRSTARKIIAQAIETPNDKLILVLRNIYPGGQRAAGEPNYISGLEPDLLGEAMVYRTLTKEGTDVYPYLDRLFDIADERAVRTGLEVLGRLSSEHSEVGEWIARVLDRDVTGRALSAFHAALAIADADSIEERGAHSLLGIHLAKALTKKGTIAIAFEIATTGLPEQTVSLREVSLWVLKTWLEHLPAAAENERAQLLTNLSNRQSELGQREEALASIQEVVSHYRKLAIAQPEEFSSDLAMSLHNLGARQLGLGHREWALASTQEAVDHRRKLVEAHPGIFLHVFTESLCNLSVIQDELGQREEALASALEAVDSCRKLAVPSEVFIGTLAACLLNLGLIQSHMGQRKEALISTQEAVDRYRDLSSGRADAFLPDRAISLINLGKMQSELGQWCTALVSIQEAVKHYRKLATSRPDAFIHILAASLSNLSGAQLTLGEREAALASIQEAVGYYFNLTTKHAKAFLPELATSLHNLSSIQSELNQKETALISIQEAVNIRRSLAEAQPEAYRSDLAGSLNNLSATQSDLGQRENALTSIQEASQYFRKLAATNPDAFLPDLAGILNNLGKMQSELGQREEALASTQEALDTIWPFFIDLPPPFEHLTRLILSNLRNLFNALNLAPPSDLLERLGTFQSRLPP